MQVTKLTLLYGIIALDKAYPGQAPLPVDKLRAILLSGQVRSDLSS